MQRLDLSKFMVLSWSRLFGDVVRLCRAIREDGFRPDVIVAVARGGWVVGRIVSDILGVSDVASLGVRFYEEVGKASKRPVVTQPLNVDVSGREVLIVDEVVDSGSTLSLAKRHVEGLEPRVVKTAAPYVKPWSRVRPDYYVAVVDKWVVFPYEARETLESIVRLAAGAGEALAADLSAIVSKLGVSSEDADYIVRVVLEDG